MKNIYILNIVSKVMELFSIAQQVYLPSNNYIVDLTIALDNVGENKLLVKCHN